MKTIDEKANIYYDRSISKLVFHYNQIIKK